MENGTTRGRLIAFGVLTGVVFAVGSLWWSSRPSAAPLGPALSGRGKPSADAGLFVEADVRNGLVVVSISRPDGALVHEVETRAADSSRWSVEWRGPKVLLRSSDIGDFFIQPKPDGGWGMRYVARADSPLDDGRVAEASFGEGGEVVLSLAKVFGEGLDSWLDIEQQVSTGVQLTRDEGDLLIDCLEWPTPERLVLHAKGEHVFVRTDGGWARAALP